MVVLAPHVSKTSSTEHFSTLKPIPCSNNNYLRTKYVMLVYFLVTAFFATSFFFIVFSFHTYRNIKSMSTDTYSYFESHYLKDYFKIVETEKFADSHIQSYKEDMKKHPGQSVESKIQTPAEYQKSIKLENPKLQIDSGDRLDNKTHDFTVNNVPADGACWFHAVLFNLFEKLKTNKDLLEKFSKYDDKMVFHESLYGFYLSKSLETISNYKTYNSVPYKDAIAIVYYMRLVLASRLRLDRIVDGLYAFHPRELHEELSLKRALHWSIWADHMSESLSLYNWLGINVGSISLKLDDKSGKTKISYNKPGDKPADFELVHENNHFQAIKEN